MTKKASSRISLSGTIVDKRTQNKMANLKPIVDEQLSEFYDKVKERLQQLRDLKQDLEKKYKEMDEEDANE